MTDILLKGGDYTFDIARPHEIGFANATDILLPFAGTVVAPADTTTPVFGGMYSFMFLSLQYPTRIEAAGRTFPFLRDFFNRPLTLDGPVLFLVADDTTFLDRFNLGELNDDISDVIEAPFKDNSLLCCTPRYLAIKLAPGVALPSDLAPLTRDEGFALRENTEDGEDAIALRDALGTGASLSGAILAFDLSGRQTEAYSALIALGVDKDIMNPPEDMRIQFVDAHGGPLSLGDFPVKNLERTPGLQDLMFFGERGYHRFQPADGTGAKAEFNLKVDTSGGPPDDEAYLFNFHHMAVWPGYSSSFKLIKESGTTIDFFKGIDDDQPKPTFIRLALFHPSDEFQSTVGGDIEVKEVNFFGTPDSEKQAIFKDNGFRLFTGRNSIKIFNSGQAYLADYYNAVSKLKEEDRLYQVNWSGHAHLHLKGSMATRLIEPEGADPASILSSLKFIRENAILVPLDPKQEEPAGPIKQDYLLLLEAEQLGEQIKNSFAVDVETLPGVGEPNAKRIHRGFVRPNMVVAWKLQGDPDTFFPPPDNDAVPDEHNAFAYWKNDVGLVQETSLSALVNANPPLSIHRPAREFPDDIIALDIDATKDPPQAVIRRKATAAAVRALFGNPAADPLLLILNLDAGSSLKLPLMPPGSDDSSADLLLGTLAEDAVEHAPGMTGDDKLAIAIIANVPAANQNYEQTLLTGFKSFKYGDEAHRNAAVPRLPTELGGLLRQAIAKGVEVRALMWEHLLGRLAGGAALAKGHSDNHQLVALVNRTVNGKRGFAFLDQATRETGAWHQKATVLMSKKASENLGSPPNTEGVAYIGGMDTATGRWETEYYFSRDPERQGSGQNDVHLKITGDAAWDVLQNFRHRWKGINHFIDDADTICQPTNAPPGSVPPELKTELEQEFEIPDPEDEPVKFPGGDVFIQVNRTIPPFTCFSPSPPAAIDEIFVDREQGELGSLASYKKGIERAQKFIFINEQYFFSQDIAVALREALVRADGPEFLILVLPVELDESEYIDPLLFKLRKRTLDILRYGFRPNPLPLNSCDERIPLPPGGPLDLSDRIALLTIVNHQGRNVYLHSKQMIVDDVWMTVGSANMSNRGMTYEMEINAACVGRELFEGGTTIVRNQRVEICRRLLGLPIAYSAILEDPYASFRLLKAIEAQQESNSLNIYPVKPMVKWLDSAFVKRVAGDTVFDEKVEKVLAMDVSDPSFNFIICNLLDADGRRESPDRLGYLAHMADVGKLFSFATATLGLVFDAACEASLKALLEAGSSVSLVVSSTIMVEEEDDQGNTSIEPKGPFQQIQDTLTFNTTLDRVELQGNPSNQFTVTISTEFTVIIQVVLTDVTAGQTLACSAETTFDPNVVIIDYGDNLSETLTIAG